MDLNAYNNMHAIIVTEPWDEWWNIFNLNSRFLICVWLAPDFFSGIFSMANLDNMTPLSQCQWVDMFCICPEPINSQQVHQPAQREGTKNMSAHVTQEKCITGGSSGITLPEKGTLVIFSLSNSVLTAVSTDTRFELSKIWFWIMFLQVL